MAGTTVDAAADPTLVVARLTASGLDSAATFGAVEPAQQELASNESGELVLGLRYEGADRC